MEFFKKDKEFYKTFFSLMIVIAFNNLIVYSVNLADNIMIGSYNEISLAGVALVNQIQFFLHMVVMGVGEGIIVLAAQYWGKKDISSINKVISIGVRFGAIFAVILGVIMFLFPTNVLSLLTNNQAIIDEGAKFLKIISLSYIFFALTTTLLAGLRSVETVKIGFFVSFSTLLINVILNYCLIYGNLGFPELGARGAAIATLTSRIIETVIVFIYISFIDKKIKFRIFDLIKIDKTLLKSYIKSGLPVILSGAMWGIAQAVQTSILGHLEQNVISANSIATTIFQIVSVLCYGAANASAVIIGKTIGQGQIKKVKRYSKIMQVIYLVVGVLTGVILFLVKDFILSFYVLTPETKSLAAGFITVLSVTVCGTAYQVACLTGIVRGGGDTKFVLINDSIFMWLVVIPISLFVAFVVKLPPVLIFICLKSDQILKCFVAVFKVNKGNWIRKLT